jgi:hypothetical protein
VWIVLIAALSLVIGLATYGYNVTRAMGVQMAKLSPSRGFAAELATALVILVASQLGLPTSSSQCITGGIVGVGLMEGFKGGVNWRLFGKQFMSWVSTLFVVGLATAALFAQVGVGEDACVWGVCGWLPQHLAGWLACTQLAAPSVLVCCARFLTPRAHPCAVLCQHTITSLNIQGVYTPSAIDGGQVLQYENGLAAANSAMLGNFNATLLGLQQASQAGGCVATHEAPWLIFCVWCREPPPLVLLALTHVSMHSSCVSPCPNRSAQDVASNKVGRSQRHAC